MPNHRGLKRHPLSAAFPDMSADEFDALKHSLNRFGQHLPILLLDGKVLDGWHRYCACQELEREPWLEDCDMRGSPSEVVASLNLDRRHLTPSQRAMVAAALSDRHAADAKERQREAGKRSKHETARVAGRLPPRGGKRSEATAAGTLAETVKVSARTQERALFVERNGTAEDKVAVLDGKATVNEKVREIQARQRQVDGEATPKRTSKPKAPDIPESVTVEQWREMSREDQERMLDCKPSGSLNKQTSEAIDWAAWSWNPITGCLHDCDYCYARDIANSERMDEFYPDKFAPALRPHRLWVPTKARVPEESTTAQRNVFVGSMADVFGKWVPKPWIEAILDVVEQCPDFNFLFLTKFPQRYREFEFPANAWLGTTVDKKGRIARAERTLGEVDSPNKWLSVEPMYQEVELEHPEQYRMVVIGGATASTQTPAFIPPWEWVFRLALQAHDAGAGVFIKTNYWNDGRPREWGNAR